MGAVRSDIAAPDFPDHTTVRGMYLERVVDPMVDRLTGGDPTMGWGGDNRLALYVAPGHGQWFLMRYNEDRTYTVVAGRNATQVDASNVVGNMILHLLAHDSRRVDVVAQVQAANRKVEADSVQRLEDWVREEGAPKLASTLLAAADR